MSDRQSGFVKFSDIESRWREDETRDLPKGVVECLRKVTPANGLLSFERFCAGLKICLLRNRTDASAPASNNNNQQLQTNENKAVQGQGRVQIHQGGFPYDPRKVVPITAVPAATVATVRPNNTVTARSLQERATSMPHLKHEPQVAPSNPSNVRQELRGYRSETGIDSGIIKEKPSPVQAQVAPVTHRTQNQGQNYNQDQGLNMPAKARFGVTGSYPSLHEQHGDAMSDGDIATFQHRDGLYAARRGGPRRREPRRHTLANGIDYNMLKRMKQLEQEKDVLLQGLEAVDRARNWYIHQINSVQDKMKYVGKSNGYMDYSTEAHQERLNFQIAQIFEANQRLTSLVESSEKGFPLHMNLALRQPQYYPRDKTSTDNLSNRIKDQNRLLTDEVGKKSERISQLEQEKAALIRELFQARSHNRRSSDDTVLM